MKKILCMLALIAIITSGCDISGRSIFGRPLFGGENRVEVRRGDTLYGIAKKYNVPAQTIISLNKLTPPYNLYVGQSLILSKSSSAKAQGHVVRRGDTLYGVAKKYDIPLRDLIETNRLYPPYSLEVGQRLTIPNNRYHIVGKGETLYSISRKYSVDVTSLSRTNDLKAPYNISVGDKLTLPGSISSTNYSESQSNSAKSSVGSTKSYSPSRYQSSYTPPASLKRKNKFSWPVKGKIISHYGTLGKGRKNDGINIRANSGTAVNAADKGVVVYAGNELKGFGNLILIKHSDGWITAYAHNERIFVRKGQSVRKGEKISAVGTTGGVNEPQLHFEIHVNKKPINPMPYLQ